MRTEADAIAEFAAQGVKFKKISDGYVLKGPAGTFRWRNAGPLDQIVYREGLGFLNVTPAIGAVSRHRPAPLLQPLDESVAHHLSRYDVDLERVRDMTTERRDEPVIFLMTTESGPVLIDGAHRLRRRMMDGCTDYWAYVLAPETVDLMRVTTEQRMPNGAWVLQDVESLTPVQALHRGQTG